MLNKFLRNSVKNNCNENNTNSTNNITNSTEKVNVRARARQATLRIQSDDDAETSIVGTGTFFGGSKSGLDFAVDDSDDGVGNPDDNDGDTDNDDDLDENDWQQEREF